MNDIQYILKFLSKGAEDNDWKTMLFSNIEEAKKRKSFLISRNFEVRVYKVQLIEISI